jgi:hypothetical protein
MLNRGSSMAYQPLSVRTGASLRLNMMDVNQVITSAINTITARLFVRGDFIKMIIIKFLFDVFMLECHGLIRPAFRSGPDILQIDAPNYIISQAADTPNIHQTSTKNEGQ